MRKSLRFSLTGLLAALGLAASLFVAANPAQAYVNSELSYKYAYVDTGNCKRTAGTLTVVAYSNGCKLNDSADDTFFKKDPGGIATKVEIYHKGRMVAKVEFHPYGEYLWVYDTANDSDTVYTSIEWNDGQWNDGGTHRAPGTSKVVEYKKVDLSMAEGSQVVFHVWDNHNYDHLFGMDNGRA